MKRKLFLGLLAAAAVSFTACQKDQTLSEVTEDNTAIGFGTYVGRDAQTKATVTDINKMKESSYTGFGVFAYYTGNTSYPSTTHGFTPSFMTNEPVDYVTDNWYYSNTKYWPGTTADNLLSFFAYAPYVETVGANGITSLPISSTTGDPILSFKDPGSVGTQFDLLYADPVNDTYYDKDDNNGYVKFIFNHALSRIGFKAKVSDEKYRVTINSINIKGKFNVSGELNLNGGIWNNLSPDAEQPLNTSYNLTSFDNNPISDKDAYAVLTNDDKYLMVLPTNFNETDLTVNVSYSYIFEYESGKWTTGSVSKDVEGSITNFNFEKGKAYILAFTIDPGEESHPIMFDVLSVTEWDDDTDNDGYDMLVSW